MYFSYFLDGVGLPEIAHFEAEDDIGKFYVCKVLVVLVSRCVVRSIAPMCALTVYTEYAYKWVLTGFIGFPRNYFSF